MPVKPKKRPLQKRAPESKSESERQIQMFMDMGMTRREAGARQAELLADKQMGKVKK